MPVTTAKDQFQQIQSDKSDMKKAQRCRMGICRGVLKDSRGCGRDTKNICCASVGSPKNKEMISCLKEIMSVSLQYLGGQVFCVKVTCLSPETHTIQKGYQFPSEKGLDLLVIRVWLSLLESTLGWLKCRLSMQETQNGQWRREGDVNYQLQLGDYLRQQRLELVLLTHLY